MFASMGGIPRYRPAHTQAACGKSKGTGYCCMQLAKCSVACFTIHAAMWAACAA